MSRSSPLLVRTLLGLALVLLLLVLVADPGRADPTPAPGWGRLNPADIAAAPRIRLDASLRRRAAPAALARAQWRVCDPCKRKRRHELIIGPYAWLAGVQGTAWQDGRSEDFEIDFEDIAKLASGGFMLYAEFRYDKWFVAFDGTWATLQKDFPWRFGTAGFKSVQRILELRAGYRVIGAPAGERCDCRCSPCPPPQRERFAMDVYLGARYWDNTTTLRIGVGPADFESSSSDSWVDPLVGVRLGYQFAPRWAVGGRIDVGGFGIGKASSFTYRSLLGLDWRFARHWTLTLGYQVIGLDRVSGSGANRNGTDITQQGPLFGLLWNL